MKLDGLGVTTEAPTASFAVEERCLRGRYARAAAVSQYQHYRTGEDNADAHLKRQVMGREVVVAVTEQIFYGEFDDRRRKRVLVEIIGSD